MRFFCSILAFQLFSLSAFPAAIGFLRPQVKFGLVNHWTMNEGTGTAASDAGLSNLVATGSGTPTWTNGTIGVASFLAGTNKYFDAGSTIRPTTFSVAAWIKTSAYPPGSYHAIATCVVYGNFYGWYLAHNSSNQVYFGHQSSTQTAYCPAGSPLTAIPVFSNTWTHVCGTYNGTTISQIYTNGVIAATTNGTPTMSYEAGDNLRIGAWSGGAATADTFYAGAIDDVRIYNRVLTADEVRQLYGGGYGSH